MARRTKKFARPNRNPNSVLSDLRGIMSKRSKRDRLVAVARSHEALSGLVWDFRQKHGWDYRNGGHVVPPTYFNSTVSEYKKNTVDREVFNAIRFLSTPQAIEAIRQRGRMRQPKKTLDKKSKEKLSKEMDAVLRWVFGNTP
ncbi:MAG: hypothetical protein JXB14_01755 [Candidatus Altiarchaeota archaeon]|nr:hypothetical protein [Candidatus Altiarchaeota archaeon]